jgi:hypothetical protein
MFWRIPFSNPVVKKKFFLCSCFQFLSQQNGKPKWIPASLPHMTFIWISCHGCLFSTGFDCCHACLSSFIVATHAFHSTGIDATHAYHTPLLSRTPFIQNRCHTHLSSGIVAKLAFYLEPILRLLNLQLQRQRYT